MRCRVSVFDVAAGYSTVHLSFMALVQMGSANRLKLSERNELMSGDEQAEESGGVVRWTPF
jgi:hypothetical protein